MVEFLSVGQRAEGIIAIGQEATGFIAIGQIATGVFALGQVARGVVAVGQVAIGFFAVGMASLGLVGAVGMVGAGARGMGLILPIVPGPARRAKLPQPGNPDAIRAGREVGWLPIHIRSEGRGVRLEHARSRIDAGIAAGCSEGAATAAKTPSVAFYGLFGPGSGGRPELRRLMRMTDPWALVGPVPVRALVAVGQLAALALACVLYCEVVLIPLGDFAITSLRSIFGS